MVLWATSAAVVAALGGLQASLWFETPAGPSIVFYCSTDVCFVICSAVHIWARVIRENNYSSSFTSGRTTLKPPSI